EETVDLLRFREGLTRAGDGEEILDGGEHHIGLGCKGVDEIRVIEAVAQKRRNALFRILGANRFENATPRGDEAGGRGNLDAIVQCREVSGVCAAARISGAADALGVYLGP